MRHVTLVCIGCNRRMPYFVRPHENIPASVETIETTSCDLCEESGTFCTETWRDAAGNDVAPPAATI